VETQLTEVDQRPPRASAGTARRVDGVPALRSAVAILRFLRDRRNEPATMSEFTRALAMNGSTCFNLLKTLEDERLVAYDARTKGYTLGIELVELASVVDGHRQVVDVALRRAAALVSDIELTCLVVRPTEDRFLVVGKVDSPKSIKVTVAVGTSFPANASVLAKSYYAFQDDHVVDAMLARHGLPAYLPNTITDAEVFKTQLAHVRERGFAESLAEYWQDHNAVASPIFDGDGGVSHLLVLVGFAFELCEDTVETMGARLREAAEQITVELGGWYDAGHRRCTTRSITTTNRGNPSE
jgi:IclR family acetate operon transcriptional repressor